MLFFIRKFVEAMLMPVGFCGLLGIAGVVFRRRWLVITGVLILYLFSTPVFSRFMIQPLERFYPAQTVAEAPMADAVVVLAGAVVRGVSATGVQWGDSSNRFFTGLNLAVAGKAPLLVLSAGAEPAHGALGQGAILKQVAVSQGFPADRIIVTPYVLTTEEEARAVSVLPGIHSILLITSAFHMPRAVMLFRARGLDVLPFPTDQRVFGRLNLTSIGLIPDTAPLRDSEIAMREYYGLMVYRMLLPFRR